MTIGNYLRTLGMVSVIGGFFGSFYLSNEIGKVQQRPQMERLIGYQNISKTIDLVVKDNSMNEGDKALLKLKEPVRDELKRLYELPEVKAGQLEIDEIMEKGKFTSYTFFGGFGMWFVGSIMARRKEE